MIPGLPQYRRHGNLHAWKDVRWGYIIEEVDRNLKKLLYEARADTFRKVYEGVDRGYVEEPGWLAEAEPPNPNKNPKT